MAHILLNSQTLHLGNEKVIRVLLRNGANLNAQNHILKETPLILAARRSMFKLGFLFILLIRFFLILKKRSVLYLKERIRQSLVYICIKLLIT